MSAVETEPMAVGRSEAGAGEASRLLLRTKEVGRRSWGWLFWAGLVLLAGGAGAAWGAGDFAALWGQGRTGPGATGTEANTTPEPATVRQSKRCSWPRATMSWPIRWLRGWIRSPENWRLFKRPRPGRTRLGANSPRSKPARSRATSRRRKRPWRCSPSSWL